MTDVLSLGPVLDLIERLIAADTAFRDATEVPAVVDATRQRNRAVLQLTLVDIHALRALLEQHAAQLRAGVELAETDSWNEIQAECFAAADFLAAPRREPKGE